MMSLWETLRISLDALFAHRVRSLLTTLGITIGIAAVTLSVGLAQGATTSVSDQIGSLGSNLLMVQPGGRPSSDGGAMRVEPAPLTMADADALADRAIAPDIAGVAPVIQAGTELRVGDKVSSLSVEASTADWLSVRSRALAGGRFFDEAEYADAAPVLVLSTDAATELFGDASDAVGRPVAVLGTTFTVTGVLDSDGGMMGMSEGVVVPMTTYHERLSYGAEGLSAIYLQAASADRLSQAHQEAESLLLARRGIADARSADFTIISQQSLVDAMAEITTILTLLLGGIAAISLVVGGIGVMNIMLVSVSERFREIGLRKALGARRRTILMQFLIEAAVLALLGGIFGLLFSAGVAWLISSLAKFPVPLSLPTVLLALGVSATIGLVAGVYPAARAARLAPIDALRRE
ncbi:MAG: ABC transporter permease [Propioniciclava sp.]|uniref:ABC transporter permease n=1 Tax=Propioniciclava sp. TaxID=2038686 RepID=UPI0039E61750